MLTNRGLKKLAFLLAGTIASFVAPPPADADVQDVVKIGFNTSTTGPYDAEGEDELHGADLAELEINREGGILGKRVELIRLDTGSNPDKGRKNAEEFSEKGVKMIFGGIHSGVAVAAGEVAHKKNIIFFGTVAASMDVTGKDGYKTTFRECSDAWMAARALGYYLLRKRQELKKYYYITADYTWGHTIEAAMRFHTETLDGKTHKGVKVKFDANDKEKENLFKQALDDAKHNETNALVLALYGDDLIKAIRIAHELGLNKSNKVQVIAPSLTLVMAQRLMTQRLDPSIMEGVIGITPWEWNVPRKYHFDKGNKFVDSFIAKYNTYPSSPAASAYTILKEYKYAVEKANTFNTPEVVTVLEGRPYVSLKDGQEWRDFDHQSIQSVFLIEGRPKRVVEADRFKLDYFNILEAYTEDNQLAIPKIDWFWERLFAGKPAYLD